MRNFIYHIARKKIKTFLLAVAIIYIDYRLKSKTFLEVKNQIKSIKPPKLFFDPSADPKRISRTINSITHHVIGAHKSCLRRSLLLWWILHGNRIECALCMGVKVENRILLGHAWVEIDQVPVNDDPDIRKIYNTISIF